MTLDLVRLMTWLSPAFPVGAFSYSHGIEHAVHDGLIRDRGSLQDWLSDLFREGAAWTDAVLLADAWRAATDGRPVKEAASLGEAMAGSAERHRETMLLGEAFLKSAEAWTSSGGPGGGEPVPYPVAVGQVGAVNGIALEPLLAAFLHGFASNLVQAALRTVPLGQGDGLATLAGLEPLIVETAARAAGSSLDDLGSAAILSDIMSMQHETQYSRLFRS